MAKKTSNKSTSKTSLQRGEFVASSGFLTRSVHVGNGVDAETGAIKRPITLGNSYRLPYDPSEMNWSSAGKSLYTRNGGANQRYLQERIASLEGGDDCVCLASGVAALSGVFFALLESGDHVVFSSITYIAAYRLLNELFNKKFKVETTIVDTSDLKAVKAAIRPNTKLVHIETPGNPVVSISYIKAIAKLAHSSGALLLVDNTFASPYNQRPLELGADLVIESLTKYINGHGDAIGGAIIGKKEILDTIRAQSQINLGGVISPFNAWLIMRGLTTLGLRMPRHNANALAVAKHLESLKCVKFVSYPGLKSHKGHSVAARQMKGGYGGVLAFALNASPDKHNEFVDRLNIITSAVSLGHDESLIVYIGEKDERRDLYPEEFRKGFFRLSLGIEDTSDLIRDIDSALKDSGLL